MDFSGRRLCAAVAAAAIGIGTNHGHDLGENPALGRSDCSLDFLLRVRTLFDHRHGACIRPGGAGHGSADPRQSNCARHRMLPRKESHHRLTSNVDVPYYFFPFKKILIHHTEAFPPSSSTAQTICRCRGTAAAIAAAVAAAVASAPVVAAGSTGALDPEPHEPARPVGSFSMHPAAVAGTVVLQNHLSDMIIERRLLT